MDEIYLNPQDITTSWLRWLGYALNIGIPPKHCQIFWKNEKGIWMTELTTDLPTPTTEIVGKGDGYVIQITKVDKIDGYKIGDGSNIEQFARQYASIENGELFNSASVRDWYPDPQGYGGPEYGRCTSNTYISWLLKSIGLVISEPAGATCWSAIPTFPGPSKS